ncbi:MAG: regulatory iron-sulfur-containing complex subunit RicT [Synergistaceae bacterium]
MNKYLAIFGKPRYLGIIEYEENISKGEAVIVESHRGEEIAIIAGAIDEEQEKTYRLLRNTLEHGDLNTKNTEPVVTDLKFISHTTEEELDESEGYRQEENEILKKSKELLKPHDLDMKMIDVEFLLGKKKLFFYFSSEQRIDFRAYVRDLAREFKTRIELRQIGVRDEAKIIRGIGPCGQQCCCSYWLNQFAPICIKMVKEQNLALNPAKISGICGRLMCCMCYEHNVYHELWEKLPNPGTKIKTPNGNIILLGIELHKQNARCFVPGRGEIKVPINKFEEFKETVMSGKEWITEEQEEVSSIVFTYEETDEDSNIKKIIDLNNSSQIKENTVPENKKVINHRRKKVKKSLDLEIKEKTSMRTDEPTDVSNETKKVKRFRFKRKSSKVS